MAVDLDEEFERAIRRAPTLPQLFEATMATAKKGILTPAPQWWKHLRDWKRTFWKKERKAAQRDTRKATE